LHNLLGELKSILIARVTMAEEQDQWSDWWQGWDWDWSYDHHDDDPWATLCPPPAPRVLRPTMLPPRPPAPPAPLDLSMIPAPPPVPPRRELLPPPPKPGSSMPPPRVIPPPAQPPVAPPEVKASLGIYEGPPRSLLLGFCYFGP